MSSPDTDTRREGRRHLPSLVGIAVALAAAALIALVVIVSPRLPADEQASPAPIPQSPISEDDAR